MGVFDRDRDHGDECLCVRCRVSQYGREAGSYDEVPLPEWMDRDLCVRCQDYPRITGEIFCGHCFWANEAEVLYGLGELQRFVDKYIGWSVFQAVNGLVA